jgi:AcrR family transcriptional regulator
MAAKSRKNTDRKTEIIEASAALFEKVGYHGASMQMVADAVKLGKPTLYHYFRSKTEILFAIHQNAITNLLDSYAARAKEDVAPNATLEGMCHDILTFISEHPGYTRAFFDHFDELEDEQKKAARAQRNQYLQLTIDAIRSGIRSGLFIKCDPRVAAFAFLGMCNWTYKWFPREERVNVKKTAEALSNMFLHGLYKRAS